MLHERKSRQEGYVSHGPSSPFPQDKHLVYVSPSEMELSSAHRGCLAYPSRLLTPHTETPLPRRDLLLASNTSKAVSDSPLPPPQPNYGLSRGALCHRLRHHNLYVLRPSPDTVTCHKPTQKQKSCSRQIWLTQMYQKKRHNRLHRHPLRALQPARRRQQHLPQQRRARAGRAEHLHRRGAGPHARGDALGSEYAAEAEGCRRLHPRAWVRVREPVSFLQLGPHPPDRWADDVPLSFY